MSDWTFADGFFREKHLSGLSFARHAVSGSSWGNAKDPAALEKICRALSLEPAALVRGQQVHESRVQRVGRSDGGKIFDRTDAFVTNEPGTALAVLTADCQPVFFADSRNRAIGLTHAGWRGTQAGIVPETAQVMAREYGSKISDLMVAIGPHIRPCCYEVGEDVAQAFPDHVKGAQGRFHLDLAVVAASQLVRAGVKAKNIHVSGFCTKENGDCFSHRRNPDQYGRMISIFQIG